MIEGILTTVHLVSLKLALGGVCDTASTAIPKLMDLIFAIHFSFCVIGLLSLRFLTKEYIFELRNTTFVGKLARNLALFTILDTICLQQLSLLTYGVIKYGAFSCVHLGRCENG